MITLAFTYRNRELRIVEKCLASLSVQSSKNFKVIFVNYGSNTEYTSELEKLLQHYPQVDYVYCPTVSQLWNKSRAVNIAFKKSDSPYFFVGDVDMIFHPDFVERLNKCKDENSAVYFQVGFLSSSESQKECAFEDYTIDFKSTAGATGMTLYPSKLLKEINGYDEFYHGWGSEDTDTHIRLRNNRIEVEFYESEVLLLHQWHPKNYRNLNSDAPFHTQLEKINSKYLEKAIQLKQFKANPTFDWGIVPEQEAYLKLEKPEKFITLTNEQPEIDAFLTGILPALKGVVEVRISNTDTKQWKNRIKKAIGKKHVVFYALEKINDRVLEAIIAQFRNCPYQYSFQPEFISLKIKLP